MKWSTLFPRYEMDSGATGGGEAATPAPTPDVPASPQNPLLTNPIFSEAPAAMTPATEAVRKLNFGGREVPVLDPVVEEVHRDYTELTRTYTQTSQQMKALEAQNAQMQQMLNLAIQQQQAAQQVQVPAPSAPSVEEVEAAKEAFMESFYEDPQKAIREMAMQLIQTEVKPVIDPIQQERDFQREAHRLMSAYPDFQATVPAMQHITSTMPELEKLGLEKVYLLAKTMAPSTPMETPVVPQAAPVDARAQFMNDPEIRNQIFNDMLREKQSQQAQTPPIMGNQPGGAIPTMPDNKPKSLREGSKALLSYLGMRE